MSRRPARVRVAGAVLLLLGGAGVGCGDTSSDDASGGPVRPAASSPASSSGAKGRWEQLPPPPLSGRTGAVAAWTGDEVVVVGGWTYLCPPAADCVAPTEPPFTDGAAFDPASRTWREIAPAPVGVVHASTAVIGGDVYVLHDQQAMRYRPADDEWDVLPSLPGAGGHRLVASAGAVIAASTSDEQEERPDWRLDLVDGTGLAWEELPDDPLPPSYDRFLVAVDDRLLLFAKPLGGGEDLARVQAAVLESTGESEWRPLPDAPGSGFQAWAIDGRVVLNPHFGPAAGGGVFDVAAQTWAPLPAPPEADTWRGDMAGVLGSAGAEFEYTSGWVLDLAAERWLEIPTHDGHPTGDDFDVAKAAIGRGLFTFGGARWEDGAEGRLVADAWWWESPIGDRP